MPAALSMADAAAPSYSTVFVVLMGLGTVFVGLICIILLCTLMGAIVRAAQKRSAGSEEPVTPPAVSEEIPNKQELIAAVSAAIAEDMGTDVSAIRILSVKRL